MRKKLQETERMKKKLKNSQRVVMFSVDERKRIKEKILT